MYQYLIIIDFSGPTTSVDNVGLIWADTPEEAIEKARKKNGLSESALRFIKARNLGKPHDGWWYFS